MTNIQMIAIAVAATIVAVLIAALVITKDKNKVADDEAKIAPPPLLGESFLDEPPRDDFSRLGRPVVVTPVPDDDIPADLPTIADAADDVGNDTAAEETEATGTATEPPAAESTGEPVAEDADGSADESTEEPSAESADEPVAEDVDGPGADAKLVMLSDIIVTTSSKMVDLSDPEVRRMLFDLVKFEIDQAAQFKASGQTIDAILQLTEAEKICLALDVDSQARSIHRMIVDLQD